ncbi:beta-N-acetylhexosaminidase [Dissulfurirhabdus thermomarina]|uniref:beta-N-acetylhexosaminidase n=1 Tax=Dissulfurirhabdus thermomarina TaxID=1765737 RepID=A0A6N9TK94_DISTH|nr:beta-N-acetylhexosaminidase [Dissulfurirhabdus thermomarina]NDY41682.1 beta-N-acetylhexosaminidase [Dissulfurirhabdus thermomarina]NMX22750.1 beta-N-acetylhexosaminidase [Dissulfurirhabdus thermomarina]
MIDAGGTRPGAVVMAGLPGPELDTATRELIRRGGVGHFILFARNAVSPGQVRDLVLALEDECRSAGLPPPLVAVDQEGGPVQRLAPPAWPALVSAAEVGASPDPAAASAAQGMAAAEVLRPAGIRLNLAPVLDLAPAGVEGVLAGRTYGDDPAAVARAGAAYVRALQAAGVGATAKHFPGIGRVGGDPHEVRPRVEAPAEVLRAEMLPFRAAVAAGVAAVMTSHVVYPALDPDRPATFSERIARGLLREELGFEGLLLTDDLEMGGVLGYEDVGEAGLSALAAGHDLLLVCHRADRAWRVVEALERGLRDGRLPEGRLIDAVRRIDAARGRLARAVSS